ncbi:MAG: hypothetical protein WC144_03950 [Sulfurimonas sp.]|jgi:hypothetical protein|nr:hypothetical protein [Sulfurimonadaceae bacterium]
MKIDNSISLGTFSNFSDKNDGSIDSSYKALIDSLVGDVEQKKEQKSTQEAIEVDAFLDKLSQKGASKFLYELNQEKIDKLVEEYRQKLIDEMGDSPEAMARIESMLREFRAELLEKSQNGLDSNQKASPKSALANLLLKI